MSKFCSKSNFCRFAPPQDAGGCPCAELCPGYCECNIVYTSTTTTVGESTSYSSTVTELTK